MSVYSGPAKWWTITSEGKKHVAKKGIVQSGLVLNLDAGVSESYPGTGTTWFDLSGSNNHFTITSTGFTYNSAGHFDMTTGNAFRTSVPTQATNCTCVFWIKTTDLQSLFLALNNSTAYFLGAYRVGNKYYNGSAGSPTFHLDTASKANIYDHLPDGQWHMVEFKSVNFSLWSSLSFNQYSQYIFDSGSIATIMIYNRNLTDKESSRNFNALRGRFGI